MSQYKKKFFYCDLAVMRLGLAGKLYCNRGSVLQLRCDGGWKFYCNIGQLGVQWIHLYCNMDEVYCNRGWLS